MTIECMFLPAGTPDRLQDDQPVVRVAPGAAGRRLSLADAIASPGGPVALVLPVERVTACAVSLPTRRARWLRQALPYAVEELLADDPELLHFALGGTIADGRHRVIVVERALLAGWLEQLQARGLEVASIHVDADLLPLDGATSVWIEEGGRCLLATPDGARLAFEPSSWPMLARACMSPVHGYGVATGCAWPDIEAYQPVVDHYALLAGGCANAIDLAQAGFARKSTGRDARSRLWLKVAGAVLLLQLAFTHGQSWYLEHQAARHYAASESIYRGLFPQDTRIVDLRAQFDAHRAGDAGSGRLIDLLGSAADILAADPSVKLVGLDYTPSAGLALQLQAHGVAELEQVRERLLATGLSVQAGPADRDGERVAMRVVVEAGA